MEIYPARALIALLLPTLACVTGASQAIDNSECGELLVETQQAQALDHISIEVPDGWTETGPGQYYGTGPTLLTTFVFDAAGSTPTGCLQTVLSIVGSQSALSTVNIDPSIATIAGQPAVFAVADGRSRSGSEAPFRGAYASISTPEWTYVLTWDAFGETAVSTVEDEAKLIIGRVTLR